MESASDERRRVLKKMYALGEGGRICAKCPHPLEGGGLCVLGMSPRATGGCTDEEVRAVMDGCPVPEMSCDTCREIGPAGAKGQVCVATGFPQAVPAVAKHRMTDEELRAAEYWAAHGGL